MERWGKIIVPLRKVWIIIGKRLGIRKTGIVKLSHDVRTCEYEDVHVLWEMLKKSESELDGAAGGRKRGHLWNIVSWARLKASFICHGV